MAKNKKRNKNHKATTNQAGVVTRPVPVAQPAGPMQVTTSPATLAEVHAINKKKESGVTFNPLDQKFLNPEVLREETLKTLAGIELQKHRLRMILVANDMKEDTVIEEGKLVTDELDRLDKVMENIQKQFADVLQLPAPEEDAE